MEIKKGAEVKELTIGFRKDFNQIIDSLRIAGSRPRLWFNVKPYYYWPHKRKRVGLEFRRTTYSLAGSFNMGETSLVTDPGPCVLLEASNEGILKFFLVNPDQLKHFLTKEFVDHSSLNKLLHFITLK